MKYIVKNLPEYFKFQDKALNSPEEFWGDIASTFVWKKKWDNVLNADMVNADIKWFEGGQLNITENCIDRHLKDRGEETAIIFEPNSPTEKAQHISYNQLSVEVNKIANVLRSQGIEKGDRICIYLPMIPELAYTMLACARIGAIHSVIFAGYSSTAIASRVNDAACKMVICADGSYRGTKEINLKSLVDKALENCPSVESVLVIKRTNGEVSMQSNRDFYLEELMQETQTICKPAVMDAEDPLFILYTSGSTGTPKGMVHTTGGYMVYTAHTFANVFQYKEKDIYWCTADIGWITGHSYILYGPLLNGATTIIYEGVPSYPDHNRFWEIVEKHKVNQFYTAPTAIRSLAKQDIKHVEKHDLSSLKVLGSVGEPINVEAWNWYYHHIGKERCPIVDTWWQTETGGILISPIPFTTPTKATFATFPLLGIQPVLMDDEGVEQEGNLTSGNLCIKKPWPGIARTVWNNHQRYKDTYFSAYPGYYFSGDAALRDPAGYYRITGRVDDVVIVSGHNLGTAPIENTINEQTIVAESAIVGYPHEVKGNALFGFITLKHEISSEEQENLKTAINEAIADQIGPIAKLSKIQFTVSLPKTRSGKIMRRILRKIAANELDNLGDTSTLLNPEAVQAIIDNRTD
ncbi:acetate--CoA ligase [Brumimicrobium salinarum]|uniref:Acetate--CoA ligase n=1 Tax=Brumimicrobium salinarum TaxID=2058658 RepID=A0A2I0R1Z5_9FLAO|nr:acetate--CoA ligase [Brumimicrobium salinarum]PKR80592.1 acetate--CoA ligase [Brumimicrobium salinarum]